MPRTGTQRWRRKWRAFARSYRKSDPWDFVARDKQLGISVEHGQQGRIRAREREYIREWGDE